MAGHQAGDRLADPGQRPRVVHTRPGLPGASPSPSASSTARPPGRPGRAGGEVDDVSRAP